MSCSAIQGKSSVLAEIIDLLLYAIAKSNTANLNATFCQERSGLLSSSGVEAVELHGRSPLFHFESS
jgi:hypothetical protein